MSVVEGVIACLAAELPAGSRLVVFGSQSRGDALPDSDIDLLIIEPRVQDRFAEMARLTRLLGMRLIPADVVVMSEEAFEQQRCLINTLAWRAAREGVFHELAA